MNTNNSDQANDEVAKVQDLLAQLSLTISNSALNTHALNNRNGNRILEVDVMMRQFSSIDPITIFATINPYLFLCEDGDKGKNGNENSITQSMALQSLITIVSTDPDRYTLPAITSIFNHVNQKLIANVATDEQHPPPCINISHDLIKVIFQQVQHSSSSSISHHATQLLLLLGTKLPPSPQQRNVTSYILILLFEHLQHLVGVLIHDEDGDDGKNNHAAKSRSVNMEAKQHSSILLIRNLSLMVEILTSASMNQKAHFYLHQQLLYKTVSSSPPIDSPTSRTILDPIIQLLTHYNKNNDDKNYDPLLIMNIFEIIEKVALSDNHTLHTWIVESSDMMDFLLSKVGFHFQASSKNDGRMVTDTDVNTDDNVDRDAGDDLCCNHQIDSFCYNSALTILSKCCQRKNDNNHSRTTNAVTTPKILTPQMMVTILQYILCQCISESYDEVEKIHYVNALITFIRGQSLDIENVSNDHESNGAIISNEMDERLKLILEKTEIIEFWFNLKHGNSKFKAVILNSFAQVLGFNNFLKGGSDGDTVDVSITTDATNNLSNEVCMTMYNMIGAVNGKTTTTEILMEYMKSCIIEIRLATYEIFKAIVINRSRNRGIFILISYNGFLATILSRDTEQTNEGKEMKYDIVKGILNSEIKGLLTDSVIRLLERYVTQGPYYLQGVRGDILLE